MMRQGIIYRNKRWRMKEMNSRRTEVVENASGVCVQRSCKMHSMLFYSLLVDLLTNLTPSPHPSK